MTVGVNQLFATISRGGALDLHAAKSTAIRGDTFEESHQHRRIEAAVRESAPPFGENPVALDPQSVDLLVQDLDVIGGEEIRRLTEHLASRLRRRGNGHRAACEEPIDMRFVL